MNNNIRPGNYSWDPKAEIVISGAEFDILFNNIKQFMESEFRPVNFLMVADSFTVLKSTLRNMIEDGTAKEITDGVEEQAKEIELEELSTPEPIDRRIPDETL